ncbi:hypothetical protein BC828DRAFT_377424 [Blastocladiella britannica]|nr:hypothetical protein BC828DRAFT_377424 [Blastocladiella britannica]
MKAALALLIVALLASLASACDPSSYPSAIAVTKPYPIVPSVSTIQGNTNAVINLSGFAQVLNGCTISLVNFTYYPDLGNTVLYGVKGDPSNTNAFQISKTVVAGSTGVVPQSFPIDFAGHSLNDFNVIKLFSLSTQTVIGYSVLYNVDANGKSSAANTTTNANASPNTINTNAAGVPHAGVVSGALAGAAAIAAFVL